MFLNSELFLIHFPYIKFLQILCSTYYKVIGMLNGLKMKLEKVLNIFGNVYVEKKLIWKLNLFRTIVSWHVLACLDLEFL
jgi:hypothetical protein